jgi:hypothetical protein
VLKFTIPKEEKVLLLGIDVNSKMIEPQLHIGLAEQRAIHI